MQADVHCDCMDQYSFNSLQMYLYSQKSKKQRV